MVAAILIAGIWGIWKALVQRRYTETAGALAVSVLFVLIALFFVYQPERTDRAGQRSGRTRSRSRSSPAPTAARSTTPQQAKRQVADHLFETLRRTAVGGARVRRARALRRHRPPRRRRLPAPGRPARPGARRLPRPPQAGHGRPRRLRAALPAPAPGLGGAQGRVRRAARGRGAARRPAVRRLPRRQGRRARGRHPAGRRRLPAPDVLGRRVRSARSARSCCSASSRWR